MKKGDGHGDGCARIEINAVATVFADVIVIVPVDAGATVFVVVDVAALEGGCHAYDA